MAIRVRFAAEHTADYELSRDGVAVALQGTPVPGGRWLPAQEGDILIETGDFGHQRECFSLRASDVSRGYVFVKGCSRARGWAGSLILLREGKNYFAGDPYFEGGVSL